jgi:hypothetical protein
MRLPLVKRHDGADLGITMRSRTRNLSNKGYKVNVGTDIKKRKDNHRVVV